MWQKWFKSPHNWVISPLTQPQVANQQEKNNNNNLKSSATVCTFARFRELFHSHLSTKKFVVKEILRTVLHDVTTNLTMLKSHFITKQEILLEKGIICIIWDLQSFKQTNSNSPTNYFYQFLSILFNNGLVQGAKQRVPI